MVEGTRQYFAPEGSVIRPFTQTEEEKTRIVQNSLRTEWDHKVLSKVDNLFWLGVENNHL